jgi:hypothetical protein
MEQCGIAPNVRKNRGQECICTELNFKDLKFKIQKARNPGKTDRDHHR